MRAALLSALALVAAACVSSPGDIGTGADGSDDGSRALRADDARAPLGAPMEGENPPDVCAQLADTEGPCALACDPDASVEDWVPAHTCVALVCPLTGGSHVTLHACRDD
jgi:hypothetical protein